MKQKDKFLEFEGDNWFERNNDAVRNKKLPDEDLALVEMQQMFFSGAESNLNILEIGCGDGYRLEWLQKNQNCICKGIEPSLKAVNTARKKGLDVYQGTADDLPFQDKSFDIVLFGFCLYLCDRDDLFRIAQEADRVLMDQGWVIIYDFYSKIPVANKYHHLDGAFSYKMDYSKIFLWHPSYTCFRKTVQPYKSNVHTDDENEWTALFILRKCMNK